MRRPSLIAAALALLLAGCLANPMPSPESPAPAKFLVSSTSAITAEGSVTVVGVMGLPRAVPKAGFVVLRQPQTGAVTVVKSGDAGTFAAVLAASAGMRIEVSFEETKERPESEPVDISIGSEVADSPGTPTTGTGGASGSSDGSVQASAPVASPPDGEGLTHVTGTELVAGQVAAVGNVRTGEVESATVAPDGSLDVALAALPGDTLLVIVRDPQNGLTSQVASLTVPTSSP